jgi:hypothetical protein
MSWFDKPMTSTLRDWVSGYDELGNPIYTTPMGDTYGTKIEPRRGDPILDALGWEDTKTPRGIPRNALGLVAEALWSGVEAPANALRGEPVTYGDAWGTALDWGLLGAAGTAPKGALRAGPARDQKGFTAYHGSPHDFDRFSMDKIGTGEGAQAYGHGLYFAQNEGVASQYRSLLSRNPRVNGVPIVGTEGGAERFLVDADGDVFEARRLAEKAAKEYRKSPTKIDQIRAEAADAAVEKLSGWMRDNAVQRPGGHMYEVRINADPDDFLDWDAPLSEQSPQVRVASPEMPAGRGRDAIDRLYSQEADQIREAFGRGEVPMDQYQRANPNVQVSNRLRDAGIPGIKYRDAGSRGVDGVEGTRNFVVFDDSLIEIVRKYGIAGAATYYGATQDEVRQQLGYNQGSQQIRNYLDGT